MICVVLLAGWCVVPTHSAREGHLREIRPVMMAEGPMPAPDPLPWPWLV
jgi:hypothetical protein